MKVIWTKHATERQQEWQKKRNEMRLRYDSDADVLIFILRDEPPVDAVEEPGGVIISYGADREPVSVEFLQVASRHLVQHGEMSVTLQTAGLTV